MPDDALPMTFYELFPLDPVIVGVVDGLVHAMPETLVDGILCFRTAATWRAYRRQAPAVFVSALAAYMAAQFHRHGSGFAVRPDEAPLVSQELEQALLPLHWRDPCDVMRAWVPRSIARQFDRPDITDQDAPHLPLFVWEARYQDFVSELAAYGYRVRRDDARLIELDRLLA